MGFLAGISVVMTWVFGFVLVRDGAQSAVADYENALGYILVILNTLCMAGQLAILIIWDLMPMRARNHTMDNPTRVVPSTRDEKRAGKTDGHVTTREQLAS